MVFNFTALKGIETSLEESKNKYKVAFWIQEVARCIVSFKVSGKTNLAVEKNDDLVVDYLEARESHFRILVIQFIQMIGFKVIVTAGLLTIGGALVLNQEMNIGQFVAAEIIILLVIGSVEKLINRLESFYDVLTSLDKIGQVVDKELESQNGEKSHFGSDFKIELNGVSYKVSSKKRPILSDINLTIGPKTSLLIKGKNGAGKSSLLGVIAGVIKPSKGNIFLGLSSLESVQINYYRSHIGMSLSGETPFEGTIRENITFGNTEISDDTIFWAIENVGLKDFIKEHPKGLGTILYPDGKRMSSSVAKKIILARAIVKKPRLLLFEDPLEQFEEEEANQIMDFLTQESHDWAMIVVSQNTRWEKFCQNTIELDGGKIISKT